MTNRWRCQSGATAVEYALMVGLIAVVILGGVATLGQSIFDDDVEVLGNVLSRDDGDDGAGGPDCESLPEHAKPPHCTTP
jgi:Flp pilus assembly pilin Flp